MSQQRGVLAIVYKAPDILVFHNRDDEKTKKALFLRKLEEFRSWRGEPGIILPILSGKFLNISKLFKQVYIRGGYEAVMREKKWTKIAEELDVPTSNTSRGHMVKKHYETFLVDYEPVFCEEFPF